MDQKYHQIQTNFENLFDILTKDLYRDKEIFVRELIQNGHDSIIRREYEQGSSLLSDERRIQITLDSDNNQICFEDHGIGMDEDDLKKYLSVIGSSGTRNAHQRLKAQGVQFPDLIGHFGIGMLSAFVVADQIEIKTRKIGNSHGYIWKSHGNQFYELFETEKKTFGTIVTIKLKEEFSYIATDDDSITDIVSRYCEFVPIPIYLNQECAPLNQECAPWNIKNPKARFTQCQGFARMHFGYQIVDAFYFDTAEINDCTLTARGVIVVNQDIHSDYAGCADLYINNILVSRQAKNILPSWATFFCAAIECPDILPTSSRSEIIEESNARQLRTILENILIDYLKKLPQEHPDTFETLERIHGSEIKELSSGIDDLFQSIYPYLHFDSNKGNISFYASKKYIYETKAFFLEQTSLMSAQYSLIADANEKFYYILHSSIEKNLLQKFCYSEKLHLENLSLFCELELLKKIPQEYSIRYQSLCSAFDSVFQKNNISASSEVREFEPHSIPAIILIKDNIDLKLKRHFDNNHRDRKIWSTILPDQLDLQGKNYTLIINGSNSVIKELVDYTEENRASLYLPIFYNALLRAEPVSPVVMLSVRDCMNNLIKDYISNSTKPVFNSNLAVNVFQDFVDSTSFPVSHAIERKTDWIRLFLIIPYSTEYQVVERAIRNVFECEPYFYEVVLANKSVRAGSYLLPSLRENMDDADGFIAEITERNANVMMEVGAVLIQNDGKPFFPLEAINVSQKLYETIPQYKKNIADFGDKMRIKYSTFLPSAEESLENIEEQIEKQIRYSFLYHGRLTNEDILSLEKMKKKRYLSYAFLNRKLGLRFTEEEKDQLCATYNTLEDLEQTKEDYSGIGQEAFLYVKQLLKEYLNE